MNKKLLVELQKYKKERGVEIPFFDHDEFLVWSDEVSPLLSFDKKISGDFSQTLTSAKVTKVMSPADYKNNVNECIGIVNQAIKKLEHSLPIEQSMNTSKPQSHDSITDLFFTSGYKIRLILIAAAFAAFLTGVSVGQSKFYAQSVAPIYQSLHESANEPSNK